MIIRNNIQKIQRTLLRDYPGIAVDYLIVDKVSRGCRLTDLYYDMVDTVSAGDNYDY